MKNIALFITTLSTIISVSTQLINNVDKLNKAYEVNFTTITRLSATEIAETSIELPSINTNSIKEILDYHQDKNKLKIVRSSRLNYIFIGKSRSGKTTSIKVLVNPFTITQFSSIFSETRDPESLSYAIANGSETYSLNFIDTPGLYETTLNLNDQRTADSIVKTIIECIKREINKIHGIFFVHKSTGVISGDDIDSLKLFLCIFGNIKEINMLITNTEMTDEQDRNRIKNDLNNHNELKNLISDKNIYYMGALDYTSYRKGMIDSTKYMLENIMTMREKLYNRLFNPTTELDINVLQSKPLIKKYMLKYEIENLKQRINENEINSNDLDFAKKQLENWERDYLELITNANESMTKCFEEMKIKSINKNDL